MKIYEINFFTGNFELDQIIKIILGTDMFLAAIISAILDNTIPGK